MKTVTVTVYEDADIIILKDSLDIPEGPCVNCSTKAECCGCTSGDAWNKRIKPVKDAGLLPTWEKINKIKKLQSNIAYNENMIRSSKQKIEEISRELTASGLEDIVQLLIGTETTTL